MVGRGRLASKINGRWEVGLKSMPEVGGGGGPQNIWDVIDLYGDSCLCNYRVIQQKLTDFQTDLLFYGHLS